MSKKHASDILKEDAIFYNQYTGKFEIDFSKINIPFTQPPKMWYPGVPETKGFGSMEPSFGMGNNNILITGADEEDHDIMVEWLVDETLKGYQNVAVYSSGRYYAIHRIVKVGVDNQGVYFKFKGDNNFLFCDPPKVRKNEILWLVIGTLN